MIEEETVITIVREEAAEKGIEIEIEADPRGRRDIRNKDPRGVKLPINEIFLR